MTLSGGGGGREGRSIIIWISVKKGAGNYVYGSLLTRPRDGPIFAKLRSEKKERRRERLLLFLLRDWEGKTETAAKAKAAAAMMNGG